MKELIKIKFEKQTNLPFPHDNIDSLRNLLTATILINSYLKKLYAISIDSRHKIDNITIGGKMDLLELIHNFGPILPIKAM